MLRATAAILAALTILSPGVAPGFGSGAVAADPPRLAPRPLASAFHAMDRGNWTRALQLAERDGPAARDLIDWHRLRAGEGTPAEILGFIERNPDWPGLDHMRRMGEAGLDGSSDAELLEWFHDSPPQTGHGVLLHAGALMRSGERGEAEASIVMAWRSMDLSTDDHIAFLATWPELLKPHHAARLDMALWKGLRTDADRMAPLVSADDWKLAEARRALQTDADGVDAKIEALSREQQESAGLAFDRFQWRLRKGRIGEARDLMLERSAIPGGLGMAEEWASRRSDWAREDMRDGRAERAYRLAAHHQLTQGSDFIDLEFLAGYIALRKLQKPEVALRHFQNLKAAVDSPISLGRSNYWIGRALEAMDKPAEAQAAYAEGAKWQTSFYGLLAAEAAGVPFDMDLTGIETYPDWQSAGFANSSLLEAGMLLLAMDRDALGERFLLQLAEGMDRTQLGQLGAMLEARGLTHLEVLLGKRAAQDGVVVPRHYYPLHPMRKMDLPVPMEMALSIARRESEFDPGVTSSVGAGGLMQLMPGTAKDVARSLGISHESSAVWGDWAYNATLGSNYLAQLSRRFDGNVLLVSTGYNAGPGRPIQWMKAFGDPRSSVVDAVDWIEHIPFDETRNYAMRVAESLPIYRARLGKTPLPVPFSEELKGNSLLDVGE